MRFWDYLKFRIKNWYYTTFDTVQLPPLKCPSCGELQTRGKRKMRYENQYSKVLVTCWADGAIFAVDPVVPVEKWKVVGIEEFLAKEDAIAAEKWRAEQKELADKGGIIRR